MVYLIIGLIALGFVTAIFNYFGNQKKKNSQKIISSDTDTKTGNKSDIYDNKQEGGSEVVTATVSECCGQHDVCERDSLLAAVSKNIEYYDDEELDAYQGFSSDEYDEKAIEDFREVLYTMLETDVAGWLRSLQLRNINLPDPIKDEVFLIIEEVKNEKLIQQFND